MSDYVYKKVVRYPLQDLMDHLEVDDPDACEEYLVEKAGDLYGGDIGFEIEITDKNNYLDFVYEYSYGESTGDFGNVRLPTNDEISTLIPDLENIFQDYFSEDRIRIVEYCYYNACECPDYYELQGSQGDKSEIEKTLANLSKEE